MGLHTLPHLPGERFDAWKSVTHGYSMTRNHSIFVDFESVQDIDLTLIKDKPVKVFLFIGEQQHKLSVELAKQFKTFHAQVEIIQLQCTGKNALDFVLAHHTGIQRAADPEGYIHILSRDKGYDALVAHLVRATRHEVFAQIPVLVDLRKLSATERLERVKTRLDTMKQKDKEARPKKRKTLGSMIHSVFLEMLHDKEVQAVITGLEQKHWIAITGDKVEYRF